MSFASAIKTLKKEFKIVEEKKDKESKEVEVSYSKDAIEYINEFMDKVIKKYDMDLIKEDSDLENYINDIMGIYEKNKDNSEMKNAQQKSGLVVNTTNVNKFIELPEGSKKLKKEELLAISAFVEKMLKMLLEETAAITVKDFKKHTVSINHIKLGIINNPILLKYYYTF